MEPSHDTDALAALGTEFTGTAPNAVIALKGDASDRRIYRLVYSSQSLIGVVGPNVAENRAFIGFARSFRAAGLHVPEVYRVSEHEQAYLQEDLGDALFSDWQRTHTTAEGVDGEAMALYGIVLQELLRFQHDAASAVDYSLCYQTREFSTEAMLFDIRYFRDNFLARLAEVPWDERRFMADCNLLVEMLCREPRNGFLYRDFQSRNVMLRDGTPWFIDFQSGRKGAPQYDLASMLYDSKGGLTTAQRETLIDQYIAGLRSRYDVDEVVFRRRFAGFAVLRLMQALGAFANLGLNKGKPTYLEFIPSRLSTMREVVSSAVILDEVPYLRGLLLRCGDGGDSE
ncbi:MAG: phosphotransferase [Bacteroidia bacterium]|nr:phosphotransferase [Bacteroidia bacterium]